MGDRFCIHDQEDVMCDVVCRRCGHQCSDHVSTTSDVMGFIADDDSDCFASDSNERCQCHKFTEKPPGIEAMAEAVK